MYSEVQKLYQDPAPLGEWLGRETELVYTGRCNKHQHHHCWTTSLTKTERPRIVTFLVGPLHDPVGGHSNAAINILHLRAETTLYVHVRNNVS